MKIIVSGSLAYDRTMDFPSRFSEHILPEKVNNLNVCFQVNGIKENFGGTAGNIAYALTLMGEKPIISATIGQDYHNYFEWLKKNGISTEYIKVIENEFTAGAYITTDQANNQITVFNPGAMNYSSSLDFDKLDPKETVVIVSPGNLEDMVNYPRLCKAKGIDYIFDPGQSLPMLHGKDLVQSIEGCRILISNGYELDLIISKTGLSKEDLLGCAGAIIVTMGERGSQVCTLDGEISIPAGKPKAVLDPTGAGDSYRGGLISGLIQGKNIEQCARIGSACASMSVECHGTQGYAFSLEEFNARLNECY
ncbi:MAG: carbohydrate kinase family protein [Deltaproteobacteria bacterium]|nr:carbohydrate kinase family protein [Deltaproteobacteria bacterium]MBW2051170.1 carbohydrate kinase family protein [Deltaproteobacteria bacterium]MBW2140004.1 carbohydrate kinase family protein [Deltaproteobacteria bacterium]MBW2322326.1 carbohydrate kinase family protein [Deltaproteobacteria bacterium]